MNGSNGYWEFQASQGIAVKSEEGEYEVNRGQGRDVYDVQRHQILTK